MQENEERQEKVGRGRPKKDHTYHGKCDVRLNMKEETMLDKLSSSYGVTRSDIMRRALRDYFKFCTDEE